MARTPHSLQCNSNGPRGTDLHHEVHESDVNSQLKRCRRDQNFDLAFFKLALRCQAKFAREAAMVRGNIVFSETFA